MTQMRKFVDRHINTVIVGIPCVRESRGKTEQVCRDKKYFRVSTLLKMKATIFEMTYTLDGIDGRLDMAEEKISELEDIALKKRLKI